jgi:hypothetical protein
MPPRATVNLRRRQHILDGDPDGTGGHRAGTGNHKTEFPATWSDDEVIAAIEAVANAPGSSRKRQGNGRLRVEGRYRTLRIRVIIDRDDATIWTAHPI